MQIRVNPQALITQGQVTRAHNEIIQGIIIPENIQGRQRGTYRADNVRRAMQQVALGLALRFANAARLQ